MTAYNLFRRKGCEALCCVVPEDTAVPGFLNGANWTFAGRIDLCASQAPTGLDEAAARAVIRLSGFYLFQEVCERHSQSQETFRLTIRRAIEERQSHVADLKIRDCGRDPQS